MTTFREGAEWMKERAARLAENCGSLGNSESIAKEIRSIPIPQPEAQGELAAAKRGVVVFAVIDDGRLHAVDLKKDRAHARRNLMGNADKVKVVPMLLSAAPQQIAAPQMPRDDEIRLAMGELTADQMRTAKAAIRWVLSRKRT